MDPEYFIELYYFVYLLILVFVFIILDLWYYVVKCLILVCHVLAGDADMAINSNTSADSYNASQ